MNFADFNIYHIFTMGFCDGETFQGACDGVQHRLYKVEKLVDYLKRLGINTILLGPLFSSESHGYDTTDYYNVDKRLGTNEDFQELVSILHDEGFRVIIDCVFNHVGRAFFAFQDLQANRENSRYKDWFLEVNFFNDNSYNDGFSYADWAGCNNLVKLNLFNPEVKTYLKEVALFWFNQFGIDGLRMDAANVMSLEFLKELSLCMKERRPDFFMLGESVHGDYGVLVRQGGLDSVTNYEGYKGLYSSLNTKNYFEIAYSLNRLFGTEYGMYQDFQTANFVDNHDVNRVASDLTNEKWLIPLYLMLYTMPGIPSIYYGSEQGAKGMRSHNSDAALRPNYESMHFDEQSELYKKISRMAAVRSVSKALKYGTYRELFVQSQQMGYLREHEDEQMIVLFNSSDEAVYCERNELFGTYDDLFLDEKLSCSGGVMLPPCSGRVLIKSEKHMVVPETINMPSEDTVRIKTVDQKQEATINIEALEPVEEAEDSSLEVIKDAVKPNMQEIMGCAISEAEKAIEEGEVPVGAVILRNGEVIATAHNLKETLKDPTAHAEMLVIREAAKKLGRWRLDDCELYVTAEPCPMCMGAVIQSRIRKLVYGTWETRFGGVETTAELGKHPMLSNSTEIYSGICEEKCQKLLERFFQKQRK